MHTHTRPWRISYICCQRRCSSACRPCWRRITKASSLFLADAFHFANSRCQLKMLFNSAASGIKRRCQKTVLRTEWWGPRGFPHNRAATLCSRQVLFSLAHGRCPALMLISVCRTDEKSICICILARMRTDTHAYINTHTKIHIEDWPMTLKQAVRVLCWDICFRYTGWKCNSGESPVYVVEHGACLSHAEIM